MRIFTFHSLLLFTAVAPFAVSATKRRSTRNASCLPFPHRQPSNNNISIPTSFVTSMSSRPCAGDVITKCKLMRIDEKLGTAARTRRNICQLRNDVSDERDDGCDGMDYSSGLKSGQNTFNNRRVFLLSSSSILAVSSIFGMPLYANAAKGAAEYDLEYYFRDIVMGNKKEGNLPASNAPPPPPPRILQGSLLPLLLDDELKSCIPVQELARLTNTPNADIAEQIKTFRSKVQPAFATRYSWKEESVTDQYYFDLTCYSLWKVASMSAGLTENYAKREEFVRNIGRQLLNDIISKQLISKESIETLNSGSQKKGLSLTGTIPCINEILKLFQSTNYCSSYRLGDKNDEERTGLKVFDELDDEEISSPSGGGAVNCLVSIFNPATLSGALQITGEGSRFAPDFVGPTLAAVWERVGGVGVGGKSGVVGVSYESYFVDPVYRPNPKDFFPDERFYQFTITRKS